MINIIIAFFLLFAFTDSFAVTITFDGIANGVSSFNYDADGDGQSDANFSKIGGGTFSFGGPGTNVLYVSQPGLTGNSVSGNDVRVDFPNGAKQTLGFGFARSISCGSFSVGYSATAEAAELQIYDSSNTLLGTVSAVPTCTATPSGKSSFVEAQISTTFSGTAAYALVDFQGSSAYILDNFLGTFGSVEIAAAAQPPQPVPTLSEWAMIIMASLMGLFAFMRLRRN